MFLAWSLSLHPPTLPAWPARAGGHNVHICVARAEAGKCCPARFLHSQTLEKASGLLSIILGLGVTKVSEKIKSWLRAGRQAPQEQADQCIASARLGAAGKEKGRGAEAPGGGLGDPTSGL